MKLVIEVERKENKKLVKVSAEFSEGMQEVKRLSDEERRLLEYVLERDARRGREEATSDGAHN